MANSIKGKSLQFNQRYVNLLANSGFKAVFGDRENKDVVISVINTLLPQNRQVADIEYAPTEHQGPYLSSKESRYDFMCKGMDGTSFIVEVQRYDDEFWFKRCVSYASRAYDGHNRAGDTYDVPPVYLIGLMEDKMKHMDESFWQDRYISEYTFREKQCHDLQDETIILIFAELGRFHKNKEECGSDLDKMCYILKNIGTLEKQPDWLQQQVYSRIFNACYISGYSEEKQKQLHKDMYDERKRNSELWTADKRGYDRGVAVGREEGREEGRADTIRKFVDAGMTVEHIASILGLDTDEVRRLLQNDSL